MNFIFPFFLGIVTSTDQHFVWRNQHGHFTGAGTGKLRQGWTSRPEGGEIGSPGRSMMVLYKIILDIYRIYLYLYIYIYTIYTYIYIYIQLIRVSNGCSMLFMANNCC